MTSPASRAAVMTDRERSNRKPGGGSAEDARHRLDVVREHLGTRGEDLGELSGVRVEVGNEQLDPAAGELGVDLADRLRVQPRPAVGQVVAGDAGDGGVLQAHRRDALGHPAGLVGVEVSGLAGVDLAEVAAPGALVAADEEGGFAVFPALVDVGAAGRFADGVQALAADERLQLGVLRPGLEPGLDPLGLALDGHLAVAHLEAEQFAAGRLEWGTRGGAGAAVSLMIVTVPARRHRPRRDGGGVHAVDQTCLSSGRPVGPSSVPPPG